MILIGLITSLAVAQRKREIGVLRALGASRSETLLSLMLEGIILALAGSVSGAALTAFAIFLFRDLIIRQTSVPFLYPNPFALLLLVLGILAFTTFSVTLATLFPVLRISRLEPGNTMKEWQ